MNYHDYHSLFESTLGASQPTAPYNDESYLNYTKLNQARMRRWDKQLQLPQVLVKKIKQLDKAQHWIIITEPWCGDAAHTVPFMIKLAQQNPLITYDLQLRDSEPFLINLYLTGNAKSIPKLIVRDETENDLFTWGPRPQPAQVLMNELKADGATFETIKVFLQNWYNADKGETFFAEFLQLWASI